MGKRKTAALRTAVSPIMSAALLLTITIVLGTVLWGSYYSASSIMLNNLNTESEYTSLKLMTSLTFSYLVSNGTHLTMILYNDGETDVVVTEIEFWQSKDTFISVMKFDPPIVIQVEETYGPIVIPIPANTLYINLKVVPKLIYDEGSEADKIRFTIELFRRVIEIN